MSTPDKFSVPQTAVTEPIQPKPPHPTTPHTHGDGDGDSVHSYVCKFKAESGQWECVEYYKRQILQDVIDSAENNVNGRAAIDQLKDFGVTVYLADHDSVDIGVLRKVVEHVSKNCNDRSKHHLDNQRCLLYRDEKGRLYNLLLKNESAGLASTWKSLLLSFSGLQAMIAITALARVFSCVNPDENSSVKPGYLSIVLGLILYEEISYVGLNCSMYIRGTPSIAAHTLISNFDSDWPRKIVLIGMALAAVQIQGSNLQHYGTVGSILLSILVIAANLGSRAWKFMKWKPVDNGGLIAPLVSIFVAATTGFIFPYMGFGKIQAGGKAAVQLVIYNSIIVAFMFVISDFDAVQNFLVVGSETCNQDMTNIVLGSWFTFTVITCIFAALKIEPPAPHPDDDDRILVEDQTSPVGFKVPNFPDYPFDQKLLNDERAECCSLRTEIIIGVIPCVLFGFGVVVTGIMEVVSHADKIVAEHMGGDV